MKKRKTFIYRCSAMAIAEEGLISSPLLATRNISTVFSAQGRFLCPSFLVTSLTTPLLHF